MRMWLVPTNMMCNKHLLGEHVEIHMFVGSFIKNRSLKTYVKEGLFDPRFIKERHDDLAIAMRLRGMKHQSDVNELVCKTIYQTFASGYLNYEHCTFVDAIHNLNELERRCTNCAYFIELERKQRS